MKRVEYEGTLSVGLVAYVILSGRFCIFTYDSLVSTPDSGILKATSTINAVEEIVAAICLEEGVQSQDLQFYDLQTMRGYHKDPGEFAFDEVAFDEDGKPRWIPTECARETMQLFCEYIGDNPRQNNVPRDPPRPDDFFRSLLRDAVPQN